MLCVTASSGHQTSADRVGLGQGTIERDAGAVVAAVDLGVAVVEAAAGVVMAAKEEA